MFTPSVRRPAKPRARFSPDVAHGIAAPVHSPDPLTLHRQRDGLDLRRAESVRQGRQVAVQLPPGERVVVAVHREGRDTRVGKPLQLFEEEELRADTSVLAVVHIPGDQDEVRLVPQCAVDGVPKGGEGGPAQKTPQRGRNLRKPGEGAVEMKNQRNV